MVVRSRFKDIFKILLNINLLFNNIIIFVNKIHRILSRSIYFRLRTHRSIEVRKTVKGNKNIY